jgi:hypothetical protein
MSKLFQYNGREWIEIAKNGITPNTQEIIDEVLGLLPIPKNGSPDSASDIVTKLESLKGKDRLNKSAIKGLEELEYHVYNRNFGNVSSQVYHDSTLSGTGSQADPLKVIFRETAKGFVNHGTDDTVVRPAGYASVEWYGSVEPTNMAVGDTWIKTI